MIGFEINQKILPPHFRLKKKWLAGILRSAEKSLKLRRDLRVSIAFVPDKTMRRLNRAYRGKDKVTDILSFGGEDEFLGELVLAWPFVRKQAKERGKKFENELALLIVHGILHLRGYDHETKRDAAKMIPLENKILKDFGYGETD